MTCIRISEDGCETEAEAMNSKVEVIVANRSRVTLTTQFRAAFANHSR